MRSLENRVQILQKERAPSSQATEPDANEQTRSQLTTPNENGTADSELHDADWTSSPSWDCAEPPAALGGDDDSLSIPSFSDALVQQIPATQSSPSFVEELKNLSLEATAERHLGSSSGLSFARLTQAVLRRLGPDPGEAAFSSVRDTDFWAFNFSAAPDILNSSLFDCFRNSFSCYPALSADFTLLGPIETTPGPSPSSPLDVPHLGRLVDFYFAHSHTLYPIIRREDFATSLEHIRTDPLCSSPHASLCLFRIWMVLAIGCTAHCSVALLEESESMAYYKKALEHFEGALSYSEMVRCDVQKDRQSTIDFS